MRRIPTRTAGTCGMSSSTPRTADSRTSNWSVPGTPGSCGSFPSPGARSSSGPRKRQGRTDGGSGRTGGGRNFPGCGQAARNPSWSTPRAAERLPSSTGNRGGDRPVGSGTSARRARGDGGGEDRPDAPREKHPVPQLPPELEEIPLRGHFRKGSPRVSGQPGDLLPEQGAPNTGHRPAYQGQVGNRGDLPRGDHGRRRHGELAPRRKRGPREGPFGSSGAGSAPIAGVFFAPS